MQAIRRLSQLDSFPKLDRGLRKSTAFGGIVTLSVVVLLLFLGISELWAFLQIHEKYEFLVDPTRSQDHSLQINLDVTVNTLCQYF
jgi:hypothetical protein